MAIVAHVWTGDDTIRYLSGKAEAMTVVNEILPAAPDVPIQIAHRARLDLEAFAARGSWDTYTDEDPWRLSAGSR